MATYVAGGATLNQTPLDWAGNVRRIKQAVAKAKTASIDILCLPELCLPGYGCEDIFLAGHLYTRCLKELEALLPDSAGICFSVGLPFLYEGKRYNAQALLADGKLLGLALKHYLANDGVYYEPRWFESWPKGQLANMVLFGQNVPIGHVVFEWKAIRIAFEICEDAWRGPDRLAHHYAARGVDVLLNPSASHFRFGKENKRHHLAAEGSRLINGTYVYVNLLGNEAGRLLFDGDVVVYDKGTLLAEAEPFAWGEFNVLAAGSIAQLPELLPIEAEYEQAVSIGLYDYMRKSRSRGFCLSLSGGADSACCAVMVHRMALYLQAAYTQKQTDIEAQLAYWPDILVALKTQETTGLMPLLLACLYQGTVNSSDTTLAAAQNLALEIGCVFKAVDINPLVASYTELAADLVGKELAWASDDIALQNIQARARAPMIWLWTNLRGALLITTSNRSEGSVGYSTMDGDMAGGLAPIAGVSKDFIRKWLLFAQKHWGYASLKVTNKLAPTAELRPAEANQTDEDDLMPYALLDQIENLLVAQKLSESDALEILGKRAEYSQETLLVNIEKFTRLWARNQWKRERLAPSFHLDGYSIDPKSWCRYPILSGE